MPARRIAALAALLLASFSSAAQTNASSPWLGVRFIDAASAAGAPSQVRVASVMEASPAEAAGIQPGDNLVSISGSPSATSAAAAQLVAAHSIGDIVNISITRAGQPLTFNVKLAAKPTFAAGECLYGYSSLGPIALSMTSGQPGVKVNYVGSEAQAAGLANGDQLTSVGGRPVSDSAGAWAMVHTFVTGEKIKLGLVHQGRSYTAELPVRCYPSPTDEQFKAAANEWRAAAGKPPLPAVVERHRLAAEEAVRRNDHASAYLEYLDGLSAFPFWAQGWYNAALLAGEQQRYQEAGRFLGRYLELAPEAADAAAVRRQIAEWEVKAKAATNTGGAWLGSSLVDVHAAGPTKTYRFSGFTEDSQLPAAGILVGDAVTATDGAPIPSLQAFVNAIAARQPGDPVELTVQSAGAPPRKVSVKTIRWRPFDPGECVYGGADIGMTFRVVPVNAIYPAFKKGLVVASIAGPAARAGIDGAPDDNIVEKIDGQEMTWSTLEQVLNQRVPGDTVHLEFRHRIPDVRMEKRQADIKLGCTVINNDSWFEGLAKDWRAAAPKPPLPSIVERYRVLAENALQEKDLPSAVYYYEVGLAAFPWWEQGWYNAALIAGQNHTYQSAARYMKNYLALAPDAPDAKTARDQMFIWEEKAKEAQQK